MSVGAAIVAAFIVGVISTLFSTLILFIFWNVCNVHELYGIPTDASFTQLLVAAIVIGSITGSRSPSSPS